MKRVIVLVGNYGSGKSELALNFAVEGKRKGSSVMVDLDIINPYFRSSDMEKMLPEMNIDVIKPIYAGTGVEGLSLPANIYSVFVDNHESVVFDVGGDSSGSIALGQYKRNFDELENLKTYFVINICRPLSSTTESILELMAQVEDSSRLKIDGIINNTNLANETTAEVLASSYDVIKEVSQKTGLRVCYTAGTRDVLEDFTKIGIMSGFSPRYIGEFLEIKRYMRRDWESFIQDAGAYNV